VHSQAGRCHHRPQLQAGGGARQDGLQVTCGATAPLSYLSTQHCTSCSAVCTRVRPGKETTIPETLRLGPDVAPQSLCSAVICDGRNCFAHQALTGSWQLHQQHSSINKRTPSLGHTMPTSQV
jgi:hypothetical protein